MGDRGLAARIILDQMSQFTALLDIEGRVLEINRAALDRGGLERDQVLGRPFWEAGWWRTGREATAWFRLAILRAAAGECVHGHVKMGDAAGIGAAEQIDFRLAPVRDNAGRVEYVFVEGRALARGEAGREAEAPPPGTRVPEDPAGPPGARGSRTAAAFPEGAAYPVVLAEPLPIFVWTARADGFIDYVNPHWRVYTGQPLEEALGWGWTSALHPDDVVRSRETWNHAVTGLRPYECEQRVRRADGVYAWHTARGIPTLDASGRVTGWVGATIEIEDRKRAEEALRAREEQLRMALEAARMSAWDHDLSTDRITLSVSDKSLFGDEPGTYNYEELNRRIHPEDRKEYVRARRERDPISREARFVLPDGSIRWVWTQGRFLRDEAGEAVRALGVTMDITERKRAEAALRRSATRLESLRDIDRAILAIQPPEKIARVALRHLARLVPCWRASVGRIDPGSQRGWILTSIGALSRRTPSGTKAPPMAIDPADFEPLRHGGSLIVDDFQERADLSERQKVLKDAGARSGASLPLLIRGKLIGSLNFFSDRPGAYTPENVEVIREAADQVAIAMHNASLYEENRLARGRLEVLSRRLIHAQEDERRQIARELHDEIGQALTAVKINLQGLGRSASGADGRTADCIALVDETLRRARGMAMDLRPPLLDDLGLVYALQWYVEQHARRTGLEGRFVAEPERLRAALEIETACFRVAQEALTNIARHAGASRFGVELSGRDGGLELVVRDDGCGFDPVGALDRAAGGASLGLVGMRERVELVGGKIAFVSAPGQGTEVRVSIPGVRPGAPAARHPGDRR
jgi:PAS domain S-box-containing protein